MPEIKSKELAKAVKGKRARLGLKSQTIADELGISRSTYSRIENGRGQLDFENLARVCRWLNVPVEYFTTGEGNRVVYYADQDKLSVVIGLINNDPCLSEEDKPKLIGIFSEMYKQFTSINENY